MKKHLIAIALLPLMVIANEGQELHDESCIACHIATHDTAFYMRDNRKVDTLPKLGGQVSRCAQNFRTGWFPDEEKAVVNYLNNTYYQFKK